MEKARLEALSPTALKAQGRLGLTAKVWKSITPKAKAGSKGRKTPPDGAIVRELLLAYERGSATMHRTAGAKKGGKKAPKAATSERESENDSGDTSSAAEDESGDSDSEGGGGEAAPPTRSKPPPRAMAKLTGKALSTAISNQLLAGNCLAINSKFVVKKGGLPGAYQCLNRRQAGYMSRLCEQHQKAADEGSFVIVESLEDDRWGKGFLVLAPLDRAESGSDSGGSDKVRVAKKARRESASTVQTTDRPATGSTAQDPKRTKREWKAQAARKAEEKVEAAVERATTKARKAARKKHGLPAGGAGDSDDDNDNDDDEEDSDDSDISGSQSGDSELSGEEDSELSLDEVEFCGSESNDYAFSEAAPCSASPKKGTPSKRDGPLRGIRPGHKVARVPPFLYRMAAIKGHDDPFGTRRKHSQKVRLVGGAFRVDDADAEKAGWPSHNAMRFDLDRLWNEYSVAMTKAGQGAAMYQGRGRKAGAGISFSSFTQFTNVVAAGGGACWSDMNTKIVTLLRRWRDLGYYKCWGTEDQVARDALQITRKNAAFAGGGAPAAAEEVEPPIP